MDSAQAKLLSYPNRFEVIRGPEGSFSSKLISLQNFPAGTILAQLGKECQVTRVKAYTSVQFAEEDEEEGHDGAAHIELGSELVYINHSCKPNVAFELADGITGLKEGRWKLRALSDVKMGDALTFAYFSTEWDMAQWFRCKCGSKDCLGEIKGAKYLSKELLDRHFINAHIKRLKQQQSLQSSSSSTTSV